MTRVAGLGVVGLGVAGLEDVRGGRGPSNKAYDIDVVEADDPDVMEADKLGDARMEVVEVGGAWRDGARTASTSIRDDVRSGTNHHRSRTRSLSLRRFSVSGLTLPIWFGFGNR